MYVKKSKIAQNSLPVPCSLFPVPCSLFPVPYNIIEGAGPAPLRGLQFADSNDFREQIAVLKLQKLDKGLMFVNYPVYSK